MRGIYSITNKKNGKIYIGSSKNIAKRWFSHISNLQYNQHHSHKLQTDWNKYGMSNFDFCILESVEDDKSLKNVEQVYLDEYKDKDNMYNIIFDTKYDNKTSISEEFINVVNFIESIPQEVIDNLKNNITIHKKELKLAKIGKEQYDLSKTWFLKNGDSVKEIYHNLYNYFNNIVKGNSKTRAWTTFTQYYHRLKGKGYSKGFIPINGKIVSEHRMNNLAFIANCFPNSFIKSQLDFKLDDDEYALSLMLNWIINVADVTKPIYIYIPSDRMENILRNFIENK